VAKQSPDDRRDDTTMPTTVGRDDLEAAGRPAEQLRAAAQVLVRYMPAGRDRTDCLRRIGLAVANLERPDTVVERCRRCAQEFSFSPRVFELRGLSLPRHCYLCRQRRREERRASGVTDYLPRPDPPP
jgi:hypothetical protein